MRMKVKSKPTVFVLALLCCFLWGSAFPAIKLGYKFMGVSSEQWMDQILYGGIRFFFAGALVVLFEWTCRRKILLPSRKMLPHIGVLGIFQTILQYICFYIGLARVPAVKGSLITGVNVFFPFLLAVLLFRSERFSYKKLFGCILGFCGLIALYLTDLSHFSRPSLMGDGMLLISAFAYGMSANVTKRFSKTDSPVLLSGYQFLFGGAVMIIVGLIAGGKVRIHDWEALLILIYLVLVSAIAYSVWSVLLKYNPVTKVTIYSFFIPVFGVCLSYMVFHETNMYQWNFILALILIVGGTYIVSKTS